MTPLRFTKGEGTGNDFVIIADPDGELDLTPAQVRGICDRRFGIGGDGVLRVVRTERAAAGPDPDIVAEPGGPEWFMDYRNSDGSIGIMCGNGIRVFARYLVDAGLAPAGRMDIGTRGGVRVVDAPESGDIAVDMGPPVREGFPRSTQVRLDGVVYEGTGIGMPNPHAVILLDSLDGLPARLPRPEPDPAHYPDDTNVEFAVVIPGTEPAARMRVHERGSGETLSCGTGACAVAVVVAERLGLRPGTPVRVEVPGGELLIAHTAGGSVRMRGPAELVADGEFRADWWAARA